jgi:hypothetical protein
MGSRYRVSDKTDWADLTAGGNVIWNILSGVPGNIAAHWPFVVVTAAIDLAEHVVRDAIEMPTTFWPNRIVDSTIKGTRQLAVTSAYSSG